MTRLLVLGGTRHVGRAAVEHAIGLGWDVTVVNRGLGRQVPAPARSLVADRTVPGELDETLSTAGDFDVVFDTWSQAPRIVRESSRLLADRTPAYVYVSSASVYAWPWTWDADESEPLVDADPAAEHTDYAADKRGAELAVLESFGDNRCLLARAGLILGPYEMVGRLPWWLHRIAAGGDVLAPGPASRPLQYVDGRDLAGWLLEAAVRGNRGPVNTVGPTGITTMGELLQTAVDVTGSAAQLRWLSADQVAEAGLEAWTELPIWAPPDGEDAAIHHIGTRRAGELGLTCRPVHDTVADTWAWIQAEGYPDTVFAGALGVDPQRERDILARLSG